MTSQQSTLIRYMISGEYYLTARINHHGRKGFMLYKGTQDPVQWFSEKQIKIIKDLLKADKLRRHTLNLSLVRRQHGKSLIKQLYKKRGKTKVTY